MTQGIFSVRQPSASIVSPTWDLAYISASPLLIIPVMLYLTRGAVTPEQVFIPVLAFATLGHHLPGYLRAYGERELFQRFRARFLVAPPLLLLTALAFTWPRALGIDHEPLHGLTFVIVMWGVWHGHMQSYGFLRMYETKRGTIKERPWVLEFATCASLFAVGVVFSEARVVAIMRPLWEAGLPLIGTGWLTGARWVVGISTALILGEFLIHALRERHNPAVRLKTVLLLGTGGIYWFSGYITTNAIVGVAMFEVFHAVQYFAIVWVFDARLREKTGASFGPLAFLFRRSWGMLFLYLGLIAAFGSIYLFSRQVLSAPAASAGSDFSVSLLAILASALFTSNILHFYYDGFIWKQSRDRKVRVSEHFLKCAALAVVVGGLFFLELTGVSTPERDMERRWALAAWAPNLPEIQPPLIADELNRGQFQQAIARAERAVALRPRLAETQNALGRSLLEAGQFSRALTPYQHAISLHPDDWELRYRKAEALLALDRQDEAEAALLSAIELRPGTDPGLHLLLGNLYRERAATGDLERARAQYRTGLDADGGSVDVRHRLFTGRKEVETQLKTRAGQAHF